jgi:2',3'-cyclic-nucleotide 2'-phosphodiesterase (5'-nucleotidase family)
VAHLLPLDPSATYTIAVNSFLLTGGDRFTTLEESKNAQTPSAVTTKPSYDTSKICRSPSPLPLPASNGG